MSTTPPDAPPLPPRRDLLRLALLAPLAAGGASLAASCASLRVGPPRAAPAAGPTSSAGVLDALEAVRAFPLPPDAEPAFVFRAAAVRAQGG